MIDHIVTTVVYTVSVARRIEAICDIFNVQHVGIDDQFRPLGYQPAITSTEYTAIHMLGPLVLGEGF